MTGPAATPGRLPRARRSPRRTPAATAARALDEALFAPTGWFVLDRTNARVPGVRPGSLDAALALIGQGAVATVVGRLRADVAVVDVDAGGAGGDAVAAALRAWCIQRSVWQLVRASGGGPGRWHVFCVPGAHAVDLVEFLAALRAEHGLRGSAVDLRRAVRPVSAPHRTTGTCPLPTGLAGALAGLRRALRAGSSPVLPAPRVPERPGPAGGATPAVVALPRPRRPLAPSWATYLATGQAQDGSGDRSLLERLATYALVAAGHDEDSAWTQITTAHPGAFTKARGRGRTWWARYVWADAVRAADTWLSTRGRPAPVGSAGQLDHAGHAGHVDRGVLAATAAARAALNEEWLRWGRDERHSMRAVLEALLERMERTGSTTVPCPERDLLLDTPLASRTTIRKTLARLQEAGFGVRLATFDPAVARAHRAAASSAAPSPGLLDLAGVPDPQDRTPPDQGSDNGSMRSAGSDARSHTWVLAARFTTPPPPPPDPVPQGQEEALRLDGPPRSHTPPPPVGIWRETGPVARSAYYALPEGQANALPLSDLAERAGAVHGPGAEPTASQLRTLAAHLATLARLGLAVVDAHGFWSRASTYAHPEVIAVAAARQHAVATAVAGERATYAQLAGGRWTHGRDLALARQAKTDVARRRAWWQALDPTEREHRRSEHAQTFAQRPFLDQHALKTRWASARTRAGQREATRHDAWITAQPGEEYAVRVAERTAAFAALPGPVRVAAATAWAAHRARYGVRRGLPAELLPAELLPAELLPAELLDTGGHEVAPAGPADVGAAAATAPALTVDLREQQLVLFDTSSDTVTLRP